MTRTLTGLLTCVCLVPGVTPTPASSQQARPGVYVEEGACPSESCTYGPWRVLRDTRLLATSEDSAAPAGVVHAADTVQALPGHVRSVPTAFLVKEGFRGTEGHAWAPGDTIWVLTYLGEGYFHIWADGKVQDEELGFSPYGGTFGTRCTGCRRGEMVRELRSEWWIKIRARNGATGWTRQSDNFEAVGT